MINKIIEFSIKNKALIWMMTLGLIIGGIYSASKVPLDALPDITNNQVLVITTAPNLGTEDIERFVTYQVELAVANLPGVEEIRSISRFGLSVVTIVFKESAGTYLPRQLVSEALLEVKERIPSGIGEPFMAPISTGLGEIYQYTLEVKPGYRERYNDMQLRTIQDWIVKRQMAMLPGVVEVNSFGGRKKQYEIAVNPDKLKSFGVSLLDVYNALEKNNDNTGAAYIEKNHQAHFIRGEGLMRSVEDVKNTWVKNVNGQPVFIRDIAEVKYGNFVRYGAFIEDGKGEAVGGIVMMLKGSNSNDVIQDVKTRMAQIQKSLPEGIYIKPFLDRSKLIKSTTSTVAENLSLGALIVIFILVLFLGNIRGGLIVASTIPLALLFAFILMHIFGVWANLMSLGALDFGILVDGAVIIVESMIFYLHRKDLTGIRLPASERDDIAYKASSKMMNSAFFGQLIILIVFIPVLTLQGVEGKMFIPMAMTFGFAVLGVMFLSLTYIPVMAATFLQAPKNDKKSFGDKIINIMENLYRPIIEWALRKKVIVISSSVILLVLGGFLFLRLGAEFIPKLDEGDIAFQIFYKPGTSLSEVTEQTNKVHRHLMKTFPDEIETIKGRIGVADVPMDPMPIDIVDNFVILKPVTEWKKAGSKNELIEKMEDELSVFTGINYEFTQPIEMRFNELLSGVREDIAIKLYGEDLDILSSKAQEIASLISGIDGISGVKAEATKGLPQITVKYNRSRMGRYGLNISDVNKVVQSAFSGGVAGKIYEGEKMFDLVVRLDKEHRKSIDDIRNLYVALPEGGQIPLQQVAQVDFKSGPMQIGRENTHRRTYVGVNVKDKDIKTLVSEIKEVLDEKLTLPAGYYITYGGAFENLERATKKLTVVVPLALALIFILVFFAIKSFKQTLMIYIAIPFAAIGGIITLYLRDMPFSISAGVGFIVLFGVAVLNGLVLISGFNELKSEGKISLNDVVKKGAIRRIRPILLTASTDILGFLPMAFSTSAGAEVQQPLATVVIGGMITSTILTLIVLPVLYKMVENKKYTLSVNPSLMTVLVLGLIFTIPAKIQAQKKLYTLQEALDSAITRYPAMKVAYYNVEKEKNLKSTLWDFGSSEIFTGKEEYNAQTPGVRNRFGISQSDMDVFAVPAKKKLYEARVDLARQKKRLSLIQLRKKLKTAWYKAEMKKEYLRLYELLDSLYSGLLNIVETRRHTGAYSKIEFLTASAKYHEINIEKQQAAGEYRSALQELNMYILSPEPFEIKIQKTDSLPLVKFDDSLKNSAIIQYHEISTRLSKAKWQREKARFFPKINLEFKNQTIDGIKGFNAWQIGISVPLTFFSQSGKNKSMKMKYHMTEAENEQKNWETQVYYAKLINEYNMMQKVLTYYTGIALPLADEQIEYSKTAYQFGEIDYTELLQSIESAIRIKRDYLMQLTQYKLILTDLEYITEK